jgi:hypothetical protein
MSSDSKETKAAPAPKSGTEAKTASTPAKETVKTESGETAASAPSRYSRGEGQKPVTAAYRENWNEIFRKKNAKKKRR